MVLGITSQSAQEPINLADEICEMIINRRLEYDIDSDPEDYQQSLADSITEFQNAKAFQTELTAQCAVDVIKFYNICLKERLLRENMHPVLKYEELAKTHQKLEKEMEELKKSHKEELDNLQKRIEELLDLVGRWKGKFEYVAEKLEAMLKIPKTKRDGDQISP